jgi:hypothetical protein
VIGKNCWEQGTAAAAHGPDCYSFYKLYKLFSCIDRLLTVSFSYFSIHFFFEVQELAASQSVCWFERQKPAPTHFGEPTCRNTESSFLVLPKFIIKSIHHSDLFRYPVTYRAMDSTQGITARGHPVSKT